MGDEYLIDEYVHIFSYPKDGTRQALAAGTTILNYDQGTIIDVDGNATKDMSNSLRALGKRACRSFMINADQDIIIQIGTNDKFPVSAGTWFKGIFLSFQRVEITTSTTANTLVIACTHPNALEIMGDVTIKGSENIPIAQDSTGSMVALMKGAYDGVLKTWKVDDQGRGQMLINDPPDIRGNVRTMGLSEHAIRTHAPPIPFDRRGDVLRWIDFESATPNYNIRTWGSPVHGRSVDASATGDFSYKVKTNVPGDQVNIDTYTDDFHVSKTGLQATFASDDSDFRILQCLNYYQNANVYRICLEYLADTSRLYLFTQYDGILLGTYTLYKSKHNFSTLKLVFDPIGLKGVRALCFGNEIDLTEYNIGASYPGYGQRSDIWCDIDITGTDVGGSDATVYIDNVVLTENEPEN